MYAYEFYWNGNDHPDFAYGALRAQNLADEIVVGWQDQTELHGFDVTLTGHALGYYDEAIHEGNAETHHDEFARDIIAQHAGSLGFDMEGEETICLGHADTMLAARALKAFSDYLQGRCDEDLPEAKAA